jgi:hypothetical protein
MGIAGVAAGIDGRVVHRVHEHLVRDLGDTLRDP